jgi:hypothetical protein
MKKPRFSKESVSGEFSDGTQFVRNWEHMYINGVYHGYPPKDCPVVFIANGEFREPKAGEHYFSGAIITAWYAKRDLTTKYWIAVPMSIKTTLTHELVPI